MIIIIGFKNEGLDIRYSNTYRYEKNIQLILMLALTVFLPQAVLAHEGHGHESPLSPGHYIANPEHFIPLALAVAAVVAFIVVRFYKVVSKQKK